MRPTSILDILLDCERDASGCLVYQGAKAKGGYGRAWFQGKRELVHKLVWEGEHGDVPVGFELAHSCHNPACCELSHLRLATHVENMSDSVAAGRIRPNSGSFQSGTAHRNAALDDEQVRLIRETPYRRGSRWTDRGSDYELAARLGVSAQTVGKIRLGRRWK